MLWLKALTVGVQVFNMTQTLTLIKQDCLSNRERDLSLKFKSKETLVVAGGLKKKRGRCPLEGHERERDNDLPAKMFSTALATMKFLSETSPWMGFSSRLGTAGFFSPGRSYFVTKKQTHSQIIGHYTRFKMSVSDRI